MSKPVQYSSVTRGVFAQAGAQYARSLDAVDLAIKAIDQLGGIAAASITSGSNVLTVTQVAAGGFAVGQSVIMTGVPAGTVISSLGTGTTGNGTYNLSSNATATASGTVTTSYNVDYMRAKWVADPTKAFGTRLGSIATPGDVNAALVAANSNFNNLPTINMTNVVANAALSLDQVVTPSFTFMAAIRLDSWRVVNHIFGTANQGTAFWMNNAGQLRMFAATGDTQYNVGVPNPFMNLNTTYVVWVSLDAATKTFRAGTANTIAMTPSVRVTGRATTTVAADLARPFGYLSATTPAGFNGNLHGYAIFSKAYAADGSVADNAMASAMTSWRGLIGAP